MGKLQALNGPAAGAPDSCTIDTREHKDYSVCRATTDNMKRNHDFSSSDSELDENIEVEKESADENGLVYKLRKTLM